ncbi:hypothetical protein WR25_19190 isoform B [Diploscapter pachys]|uniref:ShKT domain-containing protein n=1 Tax=Diploscapter pachys TaxID=2018661 RepID=A0A2A2JFH7_9BILA|nr:hypothetical protein WR25_19190 isoform B [Diploscapter pachys]
MKLTNRFIFMTNFYIHLFIFIRAEEEETTTMKSLNLNDETIPDTHALTPDERCELCQVALRTVYAHFSGAVPSRRKLGHQLKHECKRHFNYRRRCLLAIKDKTDMIYRDMTGGDFKPIRPCTAIKECKSLHSPITDKFYREMNKELSQISTTTTDSTSESPIESSTTTILSSSTTKMIAYILLIIFPLSLCQSSTNAPVEPSANISCKIKPRSMCFQGKCPQGFRCTSDNMCCDQKNLILPPAGNCTDYSKNCQAVDCNNFNMYEFAKANCRRTCNLCYDTTPVDPMYACTDLLEDCASRTNMCQDKDFVGMMAVYCPRTCLLCKWPTQGAQCGDLLDDCASRGNFCDSNNVSEYQKTIGCGQTCKRCNAPVRNQVRQDEWSP